MKISCISVLNESQSADSAKFAKVESKSWHFVAPKFHLGLAKLRPRAKAHKFRTKSVEEW